MLSDLFACPAGLFLALAFAQSIAELFSCRCNILAIARRCAYSLPACSKNNNKLTEMPKSTFSPPSSGVANGSHFGFVATSRAQVDAFYAKAVELGGQSEGAPGERARYGPQYYGAFVRNLDGHKIEAMFWDVTAG